MSKNTTLSLARPINLPAFSVIIPLYNKESTIERAINSVLLQTERSLELIIVDDGSTDRSLQIARRFDDSRISIKAQKNSGPGSARNSGVGASVAPLIAFLDADDEWLPEHLANAKVALDFDPTALAYVCGYDAGNFRNQRPNAVAQLSLAGSVEAPYDADGRTLKAHVDAMHSSCVVIRRNVFEQMGGFYDLHRCLYGEDSYLWLSVLFSGPIYWDPREFVRFHVEDSALGFATHFRKTARPISLVGGNIRNRLSSDKWPAFDRVRQTYLDLDLDMLIRSGAFTAARDLRSRNGARGRASMFRDRYRWARFRMRMLRARFRIR